MSASTLSSDLRPLTMGELLDRSAAMWRMNIWPLFALTFALHLITWAAGKYYTVELARLMPALAGGGGGGGAGPLAGMAELGKLLAGTVAVLGIYWWMSNAAALACAHFMLGRVVGSGTSMNDALRRLAQRFAPLTGVLALSGFYALWYFLIAGLPAAVVGGALVAIAVAAGGSTGWIFAAVAPAILLGFLGMFAAVLWYLLRFMIAAQVLAAEDLGVLGALRRSGELLSGRLGPGFLNLVKVRATIVVSVMWLLVLAVSTAAQIPVFILQSVFRTEGDPFMIDLELGPRIAMTIAELVGVGAQSLFAPLSIVLATLFYVDMRVRREGWDLELKLDAGAQ